MKNVIYSLFTAACLSFGACKSNESKESKEVAKEQNQEKKETKAGEKDAQFVVDATSGSYDEIAAANVAVERSTNVSIKKLAGELKDDHNAIINELKTTSTAKSISVPASPSEDATKEAANLTGKTGVDFDKAWLGKVKAMHEKSVKKYEDAANSATDADIKKWAASTLVKIKNHLNMITQLESGMKM